MTTSSTHTPKTPSFTFLPENLKKIRDILKRYPEDRSQSALLPTLWIAQRQNEGWLSRSALEEVAHILHLPLVRVYEVATFYTMFRLEPVGRHFIQLCRTTSCWLKGADKLKQTCESFLKVNAGQVTQDGLFSFEEVECLGACCNAPMVQINDDYYEDLSPKSLETILEALQNGQSPKPGSQQGRIASKPHLKSHPIEGE